MMDQREAIYDANQARTTAGEPLRVNLFLVNEGTQWNATSNKSQRIVVSQRTPEEALRLALINAGYTAPR